MKTEKLYYKPWCDSGGQIFQVFKYFNKQLQNILKKNMLFNDILLFFTSRKSTVCAILAVINETIHNDIEEGGIVGTLLFNLEKVPTILPEVYL